MRLIHTTALQPREFFAEDVPPYAILSHRWDDTEVNYQDLSEGRGPKVKGWAKVAGCCAKAASDGWNYVWIDSCCIDKTSSAELSEAINSMFKWYQKAQVCYAFLSDVSTTYNFLIDAETQFRMSKWWTRGWTLQELLAPPYLEFYDQDWAEIGTKTSLKDLISDTTKISVRHLLDFRSASVAQKMSWASQRITKRPEDEAYCLMGLFNVHMPPLYGEGRRAFHRLQLEILNQIDDESLFAWESNHNRFTGGSGASTPYLNSSYTLLAPHVRCFRKSGDVIPGLYKVSRKSAIVTNKGLCVEFPVMESTFMNSPTQTEHYLMPLNCIRTATESEPAADDRFQPSSNVALEVFENPLKPGTWSRWNWMFECSVDRNLESPIKMMYFPQVQEHSTVRNDVVKEGILIDYTGLRLYQSLLSSVYSESYEIDGTIIEKDAAYWTNATGESQHLLRTDVRLEHGVVMSFGELRSTNCFRLVILKTDSFTIFDLADARIDEDPAKILENFRQQFKGVAANTRSDRLSLCVEGSRYISATLKTVRERQTSDRFLCRITLTADNYQRWPAPTDARILQDGT